jgi:outer membrane murein-binding lipoprotein Lpp
VKIYDPDENDKALSYIKADRMLITAIRDTQAEHGNKLDTLVEGQKRLEAGHKAILDGQVLLEEKVVKLQVGQKRLEKNVATLTTDVARLNTDVATLKSDVAELKTDVATLKVGQARLEDKFDRLEALVRKGFGMDSQN